MGPLNGSLLRELTRASKSPSLSTPPPSNQMPLSPPSPSIQSVSPPPRLVPRVQSASLLPPHPIRCPFLPPHPPSNQVPLSPPSPSIQSGSPLAPMGRIKSDSPLPHIQSAPPTPSNQVPLSPTAPPPKSNDSPHPHSLRLLLERNYMGAPPSITGSPPGLKEN